MIAAPVVTVPPPDVNVPAPPVCPVVHVTTTVVTFAVAVPLPLLIAHTCVGLDGWVSTATAYAPPLATAVLKVKVVAPALTERLLPPLFCSTSPLPVRPETVPPTVYVVEPPVLLSVPLHPKPNRTPTRASGARAR